MGTGEPWELGKAFKLERTCPCSGVGKGNVMIGFDKITTYSVRLSNLSTNVEVTSCVSNSLFLVIRTILKAAFIHALGRPN